MASALPFIAVLCLAGQLWNGANGHGHDECCSPCKTCPSGWTQYMDHCFMYVHMEMDWAEAERSCTTIGGNLASIPDEDVHAFIKTIIHRATNQARQAWVGGHNAAKAGVWMWTDGTLWGGPAPKNYTADDCLMMNNLGSHNANCISRKSYVCGKRL